MCYLRLMLATNQPLIQEGIFNILSKYVEYSFVIDSSRNSNELYEKVKLMPPDFLIIDFESFDFDNAIEFLEIKKITINTRILIIINDHFFFEDVLKILNYDNINCIHRSGEVSNFLEALDATFNGSKYFDYKLIDMVLAQRKIGPDFSKSGRLTVSEKEIVKLISLGVTSNEIAIRKQLSIHTVYTHRKNIFRKLGIKNRYGMIRYINDHSACK